VRRFVPAPLARIAESYAAITARPLASASVAITVLVWLAALLIARRGTPAWRVVAALLIVLAVAASVLRDLARRRSLRGSIGIIRLVARGVDPIAAAKLTRALTLVGSEGIAPPPGTSSELAALHMERTVDRLGMDRVVARAARLASRARLATYLLSVAAAAILLTSAWSLFEGADVLVAARGVAPVRVSWLDAPEIEVRLPEYLHGDEYSVEGMKQFLVVPYGTAITVRGAALHPDRPGGRFATPLELPRRALLLAAGGLEIPFVDDGAGSWVAHLRASDSGSLRVAARFGNVVVYEPDALTLDVVADDPPRVRLEGAPRELRLADADDGIPIRYDVTDDHGLREVQLVLRAGSREERRAIARLDEDTTSFSGAELLSARDPFFKNTHVPIEVTVEARDNDPLLGPKWGASAAIVVDPPDVGEGETRRIAALRGLRDALVDTLAWRLEHPLPATDVGAWAAAELARGSADETKFDAVLARKYAGARIPARVRSVLGAAVQRTRKALDSEARTPSAATRARAIDATERMVLLVDAVAQGLASHDARDVARQLVDVVEELERGALEAQTDETRTRGEQIMNSATPVVEAGGRAMTKLGALGRDLGETVAADMLRVGRARQESDLFHAELAARDLAARLHQPDPSFSGGGSSMRAGGESGGQPGGQNTSDDGADDVEQVAAAAAQDLEQLISEHAGQVHKTEQTMAGALDNEEMQDLRKEAAAHAEAVRRAAQGLPVVGAGSDSWTGKGAAARDYAEQMARSLEAGRIAQAASGGRSAVGALDEAKRVLDERSWMPPKDASKRLDEARRKLDAERKWAEAAESEMRKRAGQRVRAPLAQLGDEEDKIGGRTRELAERGGENSPLSEQAVDSLEAAERAARRAAQALRRGEGDEGLDRQRDAQRALEAAADALRGDEDEVGGSSTGEEGRGALSHENVAIPGAAEHKTPEAFRRRVMRGLGSASSPGLKDALRRYAEGLLQ
jgi:hypothetical protein